MADPTPAAEPSYHSRFYFDPGASLTGKRAWTIFEGRPRSGARLFKIVFRSRDTPGGRRAWLQIAARTPVGVVAGQQVPITADTHRVEIAWDAARGSFALFVDGTASDELTGLPISAYRVETVNLGVTAGPSERPPGCSTSMTSPRPAPP